MNTSSPNKTRGQTLFVLKQFQTRLTTLLTAISPFI